MLTEEEMYQKARKIWATLTDEKWQFDLYIEKPIKGYGHHAGGECYLYKLETPDSEGEYVFSYSEQGSENIFIKSKNFEDIEFELAWQMAGDIEWIYLKKIPHKFKDGIPGQLRRDILLKIFSRCGPDMYEKAKRRWDEPK